MISHYSLLIIRRPCIYLFFNKRDDKNDKKANVLIYLHAPCAPQIRGVNNIDFAFTRCNSFSFHMAGRRKSVFDNVHHGATVPIHVCFIIYLYKIIQRLGRTHGRWQIASPQ